MSATAATGTVPGGASDLLALAAELVEVPSVSHHEDVLADRVSDALARCPHLELQRLGKVVVAATRLERSRRVVLAGHLDTVPPSSDAGPHLEGDTLWGLGSVDMKGGLAVMLDLACSMAQPSVDVTYVFYPCEEVERRHNGLRRLASERPELLAADVAVLAEPTAGRVEAGCQGTMRARINLTGRRAHTARPWAGVNAVHRLAPLLGVLGSYRPREVVLDGCRFAEQLQAVALEAGVAANVVPDRAVLTVNYRFAPDHDAAAAERSLRAALSTGLDAAAGDVLDVVEASPGAPPALDDPLLSTLVAATGHPARAKAGWTDVATFWELGVPATNFGPGDPLLAHTPDEHVSRRELEDVRAVLVELLGSGPPVVR